MLGVKHQVDKISFIDSRALTVSEELCHQKLCHVCLSLSLERVSLPCVCVCMCVRCTMCECVLCVCVQTWASSKDNLYILSSLYTFASHRVAQFFCFRPAKEKASAAACADPPIYMTEKFFYLNWSRRNWEATSIFLNALQLLLSRLD